MCMVDRIKALAKEKNVSISCIEQSVGLGNGIIGKWKKQSPSCDRIKLVADYLNTSIDYLVYGEEKSSPASELSADEQELLYNFKKLSDISKSRVLERAETLAELESPLVIEPEFTYIDLYEMPVSTGTGIDLSGYDKEEIKVKPGIEVEQADFCLKISGDSMEPDFHDGDIVLVKGKPKIEIGQIGIFVVNGSGYIKELGKNKLISLNDDYNDIRLTENDSVWCMGEVIGTLEEDDFLD